MDLKLPPLVKVWIPAKCRHPRQRKAIHQQSQGFIELETGKASAGAGVRCGQVTKIWYRVGDKISVGAALMSIVTVGCAGCAGSEACAKPALPRQRPARGCACAGGGRLVEVVEERRKTAGTAASPSIARMARSWD